MITNALAHVLVALFLLAEAVLAWLLVRWVASRLFRGKEVSDDNERPA